MTQTATLVPTAIIQIKFVARALRTYEKTGMIMARNGKPTQLLKLASYYTGKTYKRGQYLQAATDLDAVAQQVEQKVEIIVVGDDRRNDNNEGPYGHD